jgi:hypothetical protein
MVGLLTTSGLDDVKLGVSPMGPRRVGRVASAIAASAKQTNEVHAKAWSMGVGGARDCPTSAIEESYSICTKSPRGRTIDL